MIEQDIEIQLKQARNAQWEARDIKIRAGIKLAAITDVVNRLEKKLAAQRTSEK